MNPIGLAYVWFKVDYWCETCRKNMDKFIARGGQSFIVRADVIEKPYSYGQDHQFREYVLGLVEWHNH